jgi:hypothetical protein
MTAFHNLQVVATSVLIGCVACNAVALTTSTLVLPCTGAERFPVRIALLGNPNSYPEWTDQNLRALSDACFNEIQLNVAWLSRPHDEPLNLRDVVTADGEPESTRTAERRRQLHQRAAMAKRSGLRTLFHFGSPYMWRNPETGEVNPQSSQAFREQWYDVTNPKLVAHEVQLLRKFRAEFPEVDDILVYTYDQDAWQATEFITTGTTRGIPLHKRLPPYLAALHSAWTESRTTGSHTMWWEPWELSAGQVYECISQLPTRGFGMAIHSNIAEVQLTMPVDIWLRNTARMCSARGIPVVVEGFFGSATEEIQPLSLPSPRLIDEELLAIAGVEGVIGVKEYFGVLPNAGDLNLEMFAARMKAPAGTSTTELEHDITEQFGPVQPTVRRLCDLVAEALQVFPWDCSWYARLAGTASIDHGWNAAFIRGQQVETPSWESTRRAHFMLTEDKQPHPFLIEDVQLRLELAAEKLKEAQHVADELTSIAAGRAPEHQERVEKLRQDIDTLRRVTRSYALHLRETNVATLLRVDLENRRPLTAALVEEMRGLLAADCENQKNSGRVVEMRRAFEADPAKWVQKELLPIQNQPREKGVFTLTTR